MTKMLSRLRDFSIKYPVRKAMAASPPELALVAPPSIPSHECLYMKKIATLNNKAIEIHKLVQNKGHHFISFQGL